jgi:hypothetical protein
MGEHGHRNIKEESRRKRWRAIHDGMKKISEIVYKPG